MLRRRGLVGLSRRWLLSSSYGAWEAWEARLNEPVFQGVEPHKLLNSVEQRLLPTNYDRAYVGAVDVDLAVQVGAERPELTERILQLIYSLRHTPSTAATLDSTHHTLTAAFIRLRRRSRLTAILEDPINYGYFPDYAAANLLLDSALEDGDLEGGAKVAAYLMRQEMWENPIAVHLACLCVVRLLERRLAPPSEESSDEGGEGSSSGRVEEEEEITFKVPWLKNRYPDGHFDLKEEGAVLGKTLAWLPSQDSADALVVNLRILGYALWAPTSTEAVKFAKGVGESSVQAAANLKALLQAHGKDCGWEAEDGAYFGKSLAERGDGEGQSLGDWLEARTKESLLRWEAEDTAALQDSLKAWAETRAARVNASVERLGLRLKLEELETEAAELRDKEEELEFFQRRLEWEKALPAVTEEKATAAVSEEAAIPDDDSYSVPLPRGRGGGVSAFQVQQAQEAQLRSNLK